MFTGTTNIRWKMMFPIVLKSKSLSVNKSLEDTQRRRNVKLGQSRNATFNASV